MRSGSQAYAEVRLAFLGDIDGSVSALNDSSDTEVRDFVRSFTLDTTVMRAWVRAYFSSMSHTEHLCLSLAIDESLAGKIDAACSTLFDLVVMELDMYDTQVLFVQRTGRANSPNGDRGVLDSLLADNYTLAHQCGGRSLTNPVGGHVRATLARFHTGTSHVNDALSHPTALLVPGGSDVMDFMKSIGLEVAAVDAPERVTGVNRDCLDLALELWGHDVSRGADAAIAAAAAAYAPRD